ncbi:MAG: hypothetical protein RLZZ609_394 [Cyanobacteriota bacterium]|jgi:hypothetical protein
MSREAAYLLDSHTLLWWWFDPDRLSTAVRDLLTNPAMPVLVSVATVWEFSLKHHQGKLPPADTANPTGIPLIACWLPRPNWTVPLPNPLVRRHQPWPFLRSPVSSRISPISWTDRSTVTFMVWSPLSRSPYCALLMSRQPGRSVMARDQVLQLRASAEQRQLSRQAPDRRQSPAGARDRQASGCVLPLARVSPLAAQCLDVDAAALRTNRLTVAPSSRIKPLRWPQLITVNRESLDKLGRVLLRGLRIGASTVSIVELLRYDWTGGISAAVAWLVFLQVERRLPPLSSEPED